MCNCGHYHKGVLEEQYEKEIFKTVGFIILMLLAVLSLFYIDNPGMVTLVSVIAFTMFLVTCFSAKKVYEIHQTIKWGKLNDF